MRTPKQIKPDFLAKNSKEITQAVIANMIMKQDRPGLGGEKIGEQAVFVTDSGNR
jgi:hypothetical protein